MYTFKKLSLNKVPHLVNWYLCIDSKWMLQQLSMNEVSTNIISKAFENFLEVEVKKQKHFSNSLAVAFNQISNIKEISFSEAISQTLVRVNKKQMELLEQGNTILFQSNLTSWCYDKDDSMYKTLDVHTSESLVFPENDKINIVQFPGGSHYYVEIGNVQVKIKGKDKWDTHQEALAVAHEYVSKSNFSRRYK